MSGSTFDALVRPHLRETGQHSGWAISVLGPDGRQVDSLVVRAKDVGADGDEAAIRARLREARYDVSELTIERGTRRDDDERLEEYFVLAGLRRE